MTRQNWRVWPSSIEVEKILAQPETQSVTQATTFGGENLDHRRSRIAWLTDNATVKAMLNPYIAEARTIMGIDVDFKPEIQFTEYHASEGGKYDWHHDVDWNNSNGTDRKLSLTVQLSDPLIMTVGIFNSQKLSNYQTLQSKKAR